MKIAVIGTGYVGLVTGTCFSEMGTEVYCIDIDRKKIENLNKGIIPIFEPGLDEMVERNLRAKRLHFTTNLSSVINNVDVVFSAVGTPPNEDGGADLRYVLEVARTIGQHIEKYILVVTKSTVPVGTAQGVKEIIRKELNKRQRDDIEFDVASNPEFLKEGAAITDFMSPDRVIVGIENDRAKDLMERLYKPFTMNNYRIIYTDISSAEMIKYAANAMLATRISFMNEIANLCEIVGADVNMVRKGIGADARIGSKFLYPGCGYGGSCFPKDVKALIQTANSYNCEMKILQAVESVNDTQKQILFRKLMNYYNGDIAGKTIAVWGLAFKPKTDDMREAPSVTLINEITKSGGIVRAYDPVSMDEARQIFGSKIVFAENIYDAAKGADAIMMVTEWNEFRLPAWSRLKNILRKPVLFDGRNIYNKEELIKSGFDYFGIGV